MSKYKTIKIGDVKLENLNLTIGEESVVLWCEHDGTQYSVGNLHFETTNKELLKDMVGELFHALFDKISLIEFNKVDLK